MMISDLINELQKVAKKYGDLPIASVELNPEDESTTKPFYIECLSEDGLYVEPIVATSANTVTHDVAKASQIHLSITDERQS